MIEYVDETEAVQRAVFEARRYARPDSSVDEQAWFEAGEPDTLPAVLVEPEPRRPGAARWRYAIAAGAAVIIAVGLTIGYELGRGW